MKEKKKEKGESFWEVWLKEQLMERFDKAKALARISRGHIALSLQVWNDIPPAFMTWLADSLLLSFHFFLL